MPTPLHIAVQNGNLEEIERLLKDKTDIDVLDLYQNTPLFYAIIEGRDDMVNFLINNGADINLKNFVNYTPLQLSAEQGNYECVKTFVEAGADINNKDKKWKATPLLCSTFWGHSKIVRYLCKKGAKVAGVSAVFGYTALHLATIPGNIAIVKDLIEYGAELDCKANNGATPLLMAVGNKTENITRLLVEHGATINVQDNRGESPVYCAAMSGNTNIVKYLLSCGATMNMKTKCGDTTLHAAVTDGKEAILEALLTCSNQNVNTMRDDKCTPLHLAVKKGTIEICRLLLKHGAAPSLDMKNSKHETPVKIADELGKVNLLRLFGRKRPINGTVTVPLDFVRTEIINKAMLILRTQFPFVSGLQTICDVNEHKVTPRLSTFMQIIKEDDRYTLASTIGMSNGHIEYYDPMARENRVSDAMKQILAYGLSNFNESSKLHIHCPTIEHSFEESESGLLCIAIAISILKTGQCPKSSMLEDKDLVRENITRGIQRMNFKSWFPKYHYKGHIIEPRFRPLNPICRPSTGFTSHTIIVDLHCICHMPLDDKMVECSDCGRYIHRACVRRFEVGNWTPESSTSDNAELNVYCPDCIGGNKLPINYLPHMNRLLPNTKTFDAFVSYSYSDFAFVKHQMIPHLEDPRDPRLHFQLMIRHRNMVPGESIPEATLDAISESRKFIGIISKNYLKGQWTMFEWTHMVWHKFGSMILVLLDPYEDFEHCYIPPSLKNYLDNKLCLEWREDFNTEKRVEFWEKLRKFLDPPLNSRHALNVCGRSVVRLEPIRR